MSVVVVAPNGTARLVEEAKRIKQIKARGHVPPACGDGIGEAPARPAFRLFEPQQFYPDGAGSAVKPAGYRGRKAMRMLDAFDKMEAQARKSLFEGYQKEVGRAYGVLFEKLDAAGVRCSSVEVLSQASGGGGGEYIDALLADRRRLDEMQRRIGSGAALAVRRIRPSARNKVGLISDRALVDMVCVQGLTLTEALRRSGWAAEGQRPNGKHVKALRCALLESLDRMAGGNVKNRVQSHHSGAMPVVDASQWSGTRKKGD
ncbi:hypothetical protein [Tritonibacter horizontis]|uniref:Uncharacterized protein n=1 Tax=Tritonibacter horizontis TaxID=1768241 RepID=A0A132BTR8_9RHOB|nr:hypothetical protein [Tritonibacter horizontis]KUP91788.1 hypothetical protein TRIHO_33190 [Tritonibacter horizontis]